MTQKYVYKEVAKTLGIRYKDYRKIGISPIRDEGDQNRKLRLPNGIEITDNSTIKRFFEHIDDKENKITLPWSWKGKIKSGIPVFQYKNREYNAVTMMYLFATGFKKRPKQFRIKSFTSKNINPYYFYMDPIDKKESEKVKLIVSRKKKPTLWERICDYFWGEY